MTTGASKLQWRFLARDGSLVFLQTEYKLIANHQNQETIVARNEVLKFVDKRMEKREDSFVFFFIHC